MELSNYMQVAWRHRWLIALVTVVAVELSVFLQLRQTEVYEATAEVLLLPNNPAERLTPAPGGYFDPKRHAALQVSIMTSAEVAAEAAKAVPGKTAGDVLGAVTVSTGNEDQSIFVTARDEAPADAAGIANAVAAAYIENRRQLAVTSLQTAADEVGVQLDALTDRIAELRAQAAAVASPSSTPDAALEAANLQFLSLYSRQQDLLIDISLKKGEAELLGSARVPTTPIGTSLPAAIVLGALVGAMAGLGLAFLRNHLDDRIRTEEEAEVLTGLPVLASLPLDRSSARKSRYLATVEAPLGHLAEASRSLRTSIDLLSIDLHLTRLMITSATPGDGKTLVTANLGAAYAQAGYRTVLVSADLRRPRLESVLGVRSDGPGLRELLTSRDGVTRARLGAASAGMPSSQESAALRDSLEDALVSTSVANLTLLPAGAAPPNPSELLSSRRMDEVLDVLSDSFDMVILDTSPMLAVADPAILASKVGSVLLVASMLGTRRKALKQVTRAIHATHAQFLGVIVNKARDKRTSYASYSEVASEVTSAPPRSGAHDDDDRTLGRPAPAEHSAS